MAIEIMNNCSSSAFVHVITYKARETVREAGTLEEVAVGRYIHQTLYLYNNGYKWCYMGI